MREFVCMRWGGFASARHVNVLAAMLRRHYRRPHRLSVVTDDPSGLDPDIRVLPLWSDHRHAGRCMLKLKLFHPSMRELIGERFAYLDLDVVICGDVTALFDREEDFVISGVELPGQPYNSSLMLMNAGCRARVFEAFDPATWRARAKARGYGGTDQAVVMLTLGPGEATWTTADGVFSYRDHVERVPGRPLPSGARIVQLNGRRFDPADPLLQHASPWIAEHWSE